MYATPKKGKLESSAGASSARVGDINMNHLPSNLVSPPATQHSTPQKETHLNILSSFVRTPVKYNLDGAPKVKADWPRISPEKTQERHREHQAMKLEAKEAGRAAYNETTHRKELKQQVFALENRLRRLQLEEQRTQKKIKETSEKTYRTLCNKQRHCDDLRNKSANKTRNGLELNQRRQSLHIQRTQHLNSKKESVEDMLRTRQQAADTVKLEIKHARAMQNQDQTNQTQRNADLIRNIKDDQQQSIEKRKDMARVQRNQSTQSYRSRVNAEKSEAEQLEARLSDLAVLEEQLVANLNRTYALQRSKEEELERTANLNAASLEPETSLVSKRNS